MPELAFVVCGTVEDFPEPQDDWRKTACVECGKDIWTTPEGRESAKTNRALTVCMGCASRLSEEYPTEARALDGQSFGGPEENAKVLQMLKTLAEQLKGRSEDVPEHLKAALEGNDNFERMKATAELGASKMTHPDEDWGSMCVLQDYEGNTYPPFPISDAMEKGTPKELLAKRIIPAIAISVEAQNVCFGISAWTLNPDGHEPLPSGSFADHPDRGEALVIIEVTADGVQRTTSAKVTRDGVNPPKLGPWEDVLEPAKSDGLFIEALVPTLALLRATRV